MLTGAKILVTGASGQVAFPIAMYLARDNEVWGGARFQDQATLDRVAVAGIRPVAIDLPSGAFAGIPDDFDYLLHFGFTRGGVTEFDRAIRVNGEGTGFILQHCRAAKAALVVSAAAIYSPYTDPWHAQRWCTDAAGLLGVQPRLVVQVGPNVPPSNIADVTKRHAITGPCRVRFADGLARLVVEHHSMHRL
jgi:nucleoside-diphosphate-sugar epimerase